MHFAMMPATWPRFSLDRQAQLISSGVIYTMNWLWLIPYTFFRIRQRCAWPCSHLACCVPPPSQSHNQCKMLKVGIGVPSWSREIAKLSNEPPNCCRLAGQINKLHLMIMQNFRHALILVFLTNAGLTQLVEWQALNLLVMGSSPIFG